MDLLDIEELFKSEDLAKAVNRRAIEMLLSNSKILKNPNSSLEQRKQAQSNIETIISGKIPKAPSSSKPKNIKQDVQQPLVPKLQYSPDYMHYGVTKEHWNNAAPEAHKELAEHHANVMAGKLPEYINVKNTIEAKNKVLKSLDNVYSNLYKIFETLK
jgi:hypothetical protein